MIELQELFHFGNSYETLFILGIIIISYAFGFWAGLICTLASIFAVDYFLHPPVYHLKVFHLKQALRSSVFLISGVFISILNARLRHAHAQLHAPNHHPKTLMKNLPVGVFITDPTGRIIEINPRAEEIWESHHMVGSSDYSHYQAWHPEDGKPILADEWPIVRALQSKETTPAEQIQIRTFGGKIKTILNCATPIYGANQETLGAIAVFQDITESG